MLHPYYDVEVQDVGHGVETEQGLVVHVLDCMEPLDLLWVRVEDDEGLPWGDVIVELEVVGVGVVGDYVLLEPHDLAPSEPVDRVLEEVVVPFVRA